jgi:hypothetical protein
MKEKCYVCSRKASVASKYCLYHSQALEGLKEEHKTWIKAYGKISWNDFLDKLLKLDETGIWVKEVIIVELKR